MSAQLTVSQRSNRRQRTALANVRLHPDELDNLKKTAQEDGTSVGEVIRRALIATRAIRSTV